VSDSISLGSYSTGIRGTWFWNPRTAKAKGGEPIKDGQDKEDLVVPSRVVLSMVGYLEDVVRLDSETLAKYGFGPDTKLDLSKIEEPAGTQQDLFKDIMENF